MMAVQIHFDLSDSEHPATTRRTAGSWDQVRCSRKPGCEFWNRSQKSKQGIESRNRENISCSWSLKCLLNGTEVQLACAICCLVTMYGRAYATWLFLHSAVQRDRTAHSGSDGLSLYPTKDVASPRNSATGHIRRKGQDYGGASAPGVMVSPSMEIDSHPRRMDHTSCVDCLKYLYCLPSFKYPQWQRRPRTARRLQEWSRIHLAL